MFKFDGGEFVRLILEDPVIEDPGSGVKVGDCGVVWGVYDAEPPFYEATFVTQSGELSDLMFYENAVELLSDVREAPCPERLLEILNLFERFAEGSSDPPQ